MAAYHVWTTRNSLASTADSSGNLKNLVNLQSPDFSLDRFSWVLQTAIDLGTWVSQLYSLLLCEISKTKKKKGIWIHNSYATLPFWVAKVLFTTFISTLNL